MKHKIITSIIIAVILLIVSLQLAPVLLKSEKDEMVKNKLVAAHIYDMMKSAVERPIIVSESMCADEFLQSALANELSVPEKKIEAEMASYLTSIKNEFGYIAAFVVSEETHRYYTPRGINKIVNPKSEPYDIWYQLFLESGKDIDLDTDRDQANGYRWTVFVNTRITDARGKLLGVCGVGVFMDVLQEIVLDAEEKYDVKINLIDPEGLVQVDSDSTNIENAYISEAISDHATAESFTYMKRSMGGFRMTRYLPELEWYLVVQSFGQNVIGFGIKLPLIILYLLLVSLLILILTKKYSIEVHKLIKTQELEDKLTGLPNRNYLYESYGELGVFNTTRYKSLVMFDIDQFKTVSEETDGDKIILGVAELAKKAMEGHGLLFRWSGDEFVAFLEMDADEAEKRFTEFCAEVRGALDVTVSVGLVEIDLAESIKTNYHRAVQPCYAVKEAGGNGVRRK